MTASLKEQIAAVRGAQHTRRHQAQFDDGLSLGASLAADALADAITTLEHSADLQRTFDLRWAADQRAIKRWQDAHPGNEMVWPDRCDMVVWLLDRMDEAEKRLQYREGHREPCYYCGEPCNSLAGNPGMWPVALSHADDPGVVKFHHADCVTMRLEIKP